MSLILLCRIRSHHCNFKDVLVRGHDIRFQDCAHLVTLKFLPSQGDRIAQLILECIVTPDVIEAQELPSSERVGSFFTSCMSMRLLAGTDDRNTTHLLLACTDDRYTL